MLTLPGPAQEQIWEEDFPRSIWGDLKPNIMSMAENGNNEVDINMLANFDMTTNNRLF